MSPPGKPKVGGQKFFSLAPLAKLYPHLHNRCAAPAFSLISVFQFSPNNFNAVRCGQTVLYVRLNPSQPFAFCEFLTSSHYPIRHIVEITPSNECWSNRQLMPVLVILMRTNRHVDYLSQAVLIFRLRNYLYCVGWGVKLYSLTHPF